MTEPLDEIVEELKESLKDGLAHVYAACASFRDELGEELNKDRWVMAERLRAKEAWSKLNRFCKAARALLEAPRPEEKANHEQTKAEDPG